MNFLIILFILYITNIKFTHQESNESSENEEVDVVTVDKVDDKIWRPWCDDFSKKFHRTLRNRIIDANHAINMEMMMNRRRNGNPFDVQRIPSSMTNRRFGLDRSLPRPYDTTRHHSLNLCQGRTAQSSSGSSSRSQPSSSSSNSPVSCQNLMHNALAEEGIQNFELAHWCNICGRYAGSSDSLARHQSRHHSQ